MLQNNRIDSLDSLRGIASMIVVIFHCLISFPLFFTANFKGDYENIFIELFTTTPLHTIWAGKEAVLLFFVLSGFVLSLPFINNRVPAYSVYVIKRVFRIYVPYIIIMIFSSVLVMMFATFNDIESMSFNYNNRWDHPVTLQAIIAYILMFNIDTPNVNGVVWTLFHEMRISLFFPLLMLIITRFNWVNALIIALGINSALYFIVGSYAHLISHGLLSSFIGSFKDTFYYTSFFIFGAVLAKCRISVMCFIKPCSPSTKGILLFLSIVLINNRWIKVVFTFENSKLEDMFSVSGILLFLSLVLSSKRLDLILTKKPLIFLGKISYSLYLVHIPVMMMLSIYLSKLIPIGITFLLVPFVTIPVAFLSYKFIEEPSNKLGRKISRLFQHSNLNNKTTKKTIAFSSLVQKKNL